MDKVYDVKIEVTLEIHANNWEEAKKAAATWEGEHDSAWMGKQNFLIFWHNFRKRVRDVKLNKTKTKSLELKHNQEIEKSKEINIWTDSKYKYS
jgi:hypothetical protein